jgi:hypothetical protein
MISILPLNEHHLDKCCIYRIWLGNKFYIGATINSYNRILGHNKAIAGAYEGKKIGKNSITNMYNHLVANPHIDTGFFEILEECDNELDLVDAEHDWLCNFEGNPDCLNQSFKIHRTINNIIVRPNGDFTIKKVIKMNKWFKITDIPPSENHVVYKIWYADKYLVIGGKTLDRSIANINTNLGYFFKDTANGRNPNDMYYNFYCHVDEFPMQKFNIEIILDTKSIYEYLKTWHLELSKGRYDKQCLNLYFEPYIPKSTQKKRGSWLNRGAYLNYMKWKNKTTHKMTA